MKLTLTESELRNIVSIGIRIKYPHLSKETLRIEFLNKPELVYSGVFSDHFRNVISADITTVAPTAHVDRWKGQK